MDKRSDRRKKQIRLCDQVNTWIGKYQYSIQVLMTIITVLLTFLSVYYGYKLADSQAKNLEKEKAIKLLQIATNDLKNKEASLDNIPPNFNISGLNMIHGYLKLDPIKYPDKFSNVINNELVMKWISAKTYSKLIISEDNLKLMTKVINEEISSDSNLTLMINMHKKELDYTQKIIDAEIKLLKGEINETELNTLQESYHEEVIKFQDEQSRKASISIDFSKAKKSIELDAEIKKLSK